MRLLSACLLLQLSSFAAESPQLIPFQGTLVDSAGTAYANGQYAITFALYNEPVGGTPVWVERHEKVGVMNGMVNVFLGSINSLLKTNWSDSVNFGTTKYLGITVDADGSPATADKEMAPRQLVITAFHAPTTDKLQGHGWNVLYGSQNPNTSTFQLTKMPSIGLDKLPQIPAAKLPPNLTLDELQQAGQSAIPAGGMIFSQEPANAGLLNLGYTSSGSIEVSPPTQAIPPPPLSGREGAYVVWTGNDLVIWGGGTRPLAFFNDGAKYNAQTGAWTAMSSSGAPVARRGDNDCGGGRGVWTGQAVLIWGGYTGGTTSNGTGALYNPATDSWTAMATANGPDARFAFAEAWTGSRYLVWGGLNRVPGSDTYRANGFIYNPTTNTWSAMNSTGAPTARGWMCYCWTGSELFIWSGNTGVTQPGDGALYNPASDTWRPVSAAGAPAARYGAQCVWTGSRVWVWGGGPTLASGALFDPATNTWQAMAESPIKSNRIQASAAWTGDAVMVAGGGEWGTSGSGLADVTPLADAAAYFPATNTWRLLRGAQPGRFNHVMPWMASRSAGAMFGGVSSAQMISTVQMFTIPQVLHLYTK